MSSTLYWKPKVREGSSLPYELKRILEDRLSSDTTTFGQESLGYLNGLNDAGVKGAEELINALLRHQEVELWLEY